MTNTTVLEVQAQRLLGQEQTADHEARVAAKVAELKAEEDRRAREATAQAEAERRAKAIAKSRKRAQHQASLIEDALQVLTSAVAELYSLPHTDEVAPNSRNVITNRCNHVLGGLLPHLRDIRVPGDDQPLTETLVPGGRA